MSALSITASLVRWLGPWAPDDQAPSGVARRRVRVAAQGREFDAWVYAPARATPHGALLVLPGLHYLGPADPRLDRFSRVLARAGVVVLAPFLPTFARLHVGEELVPDALAAYDLMRALPEVQALEARGLRPGVFSISTGSLPAAHVCAERDTGGWVVFGGYRSFEACIRFSLRGHEAGVLADPLNRPVVYLNLLPWLPAVPDDTRPLERALRRYAEQTWGRPELKVDERWRPTAERLQDELGGSARALFRRATGLEDPEGEVGLAALEAAGDAFKSMDPGPAIARYHGPSVVVHGRDDDVIPISEAHALHASLCEAGGQSRLYLTGMYGHTGSSSFALVDAGREAQSMLGIVRGIAMSARGVVD